jgi:hypothetical protein
VNNIFNLPGAPATSRRPVLPVVTGR